MKNRACAGLLLTVSASLAVAQDGPTKPGRLIVPSSPGGGTDVFARRLAQSLSDSLKQQSVVAIRPGAGGNIGAPATAAAAPDGYALLVASNSSPAINPALYKSLPHSAERDLTPVARGVMAVNVRVVSDVLAFER